MPGIIFETFDAAYTVGECDGEFVLSGNALSEAILGADGVLLLQGEGYADVLFLAEPEIPPVGDGSMYVTGEGVGSVGVVAESEGDLYLAGESYGGVPAVAGQTLGFTDSALALRGNAFEQIQPSAYGMLVEMPPIINSSYGASFSTFEDDLIVQDASFADFVALLRDSVSFSDQFSVLFKVLATIDDSLVVRDFVTYVAVAQVNDGFDIAALSTGELRIVGLIADQLIVNDDSIPWLSAVHTILAAMSFRDAMVAGRDGTIDSTVALLAEFEARIAAVGTLVAEVALADEFQSGLVLFALLTSDLVLADDWQTNVAAIAEILDGFSLGVRFTVGDDTYIGYTVNTKNSAVSAYENYAFNSLTLIGGKPYGAGTDGIYALDDGDTDDGDPIAARLRLGVSNFGTMLGKRVPHAYVGYTSDGSLVLKTITMDGGSKKENWYRMKKRPEGAPAESRFDPAKGLQGVYWGFELVNEAGADFTLDTLQVYPVIINRRYSGR